MKDTLLTRMDSLLCLAVVTAAVVFVCDVQVANSEPLSSGRTHVTSEIDMVLSPVDKLTPATSSTRKKRFRYRIVLKNFMQLQFKNVWNNQLTNLSM